MLQYSSHQTTKCSSQRENGYHIDLPDRTKWPGCDWDSRTKNEPGFAFSINTYRSVQK
jgi:hypothetical protein